MEIEKYYLNIYKECLNKINETPEKYDKSLSENSIMIDFNIVLFYELKSNLKYIKNEKKKVLFFIKMYKFIKKYLSLKCTEEDINFIIINENFIKFMEKSIIFLNYAIDIVRILLENKQTNLDMEYFLNSLDEYEVITTINNYNLNIKLNFIEVIDNFSTTENDKIQTLIDNMIKQRSLIFKDDI